jgi:hypothetical protein
MLPPETVRRVPEEGFGQVTLGGVRFHTDPNQYSPLTWPRRYSVHQGIGGSVTIQDFGVSPQDVRLLLRSGPQWKLDRQTVAELHRLARASNPTYTFTDWLDNEFSVFFGRFDPRPSDSGTFTFEMELHVMSVSRLLGSPFNEGKQGSR